MLYKSHFDSVHILIFICSYWFHIPESFTYMQGLNGFIDVTLASDAVLIKVLFHARSLFFRNPGPKKPKNDQIWTK